MSIEASITAQNTFSPTHYVQVGDQEEKTVQVSVFGTFVATVSVQIRKTSADSWRTIDTTTDIGEYKLELKGPWEVRAGVETGNFTSGTVGIELH